MGLIRSSLLNSNFPALKDRACARQDYGQIIPLAIDSIFEAGTWHDNKESGHKSSGFRWLMASCAAVMSTSRI